MMGEDDEYDDLYNDVNVGEGFIQNVGNPSENENGVEENDGMGQMIESTQRVDNDGSAEKEEEYDEGSKGLGDSSKNLGEGFKGYGEGPKGLGEVSKGPGEASKGTGESQGLKLNLGQGFRGQEDVKNGDLGGRGSGVRGGASLLGTNKSQSKGSVNENSNAGNIRNVEVGGGGGGNGGTMLFVGELHWWTTDAELEAELSKYGRVKEVKFFDEKASGKSKGYCQVEFCDAGAASACKEGMNGHVFNGRPCVVAYASPHTVRQMGAAQMNKSQGQSQGQTQGQSQQRRSMGDGSGGRGGGSSYQGSSDGGRNYGKTGWGRGGQGGSNRGQGGGQGRGRGGMKNSGSSGGGGGNGGGGLYGQGIPGPPMGGPPGGMMHPQGMMGQGFDPTYGAHMGRGGGYGGFSSHGPPFPGMMPTFPPVGTVGLPGVAPHVNPAFFGRGVAGNGMGMMSSGGMDGHQSGMWGDSGMGGWGGEEHNRRMRESSYGEDGGSEYGYSEIAHERGGRSSAPRDKERGTDRDWTDRRRRDDRETDWHRDRYREEKDGYMDQRQRERDWENEDDWEKEKPSRSRGKGRIVEEDDQRPRSKEADYGKRRRLPADITE
ncbi:glycine-rich cell wall structural protein 1.8 isoform X2 [Cryptomeria japonica]|nr:glycine-rich cell wall structural protein 1.8 isoform X2 [Cryptomeria japonica]